VAFYWGTTAQEYREIGGMRNNLRANWMVSFAGMMRKVSGER